MTRAEFSAAAFILGGSWPGEFTKNDEAAYWHMLSDFPAAAVMAALKAMRGAKFRPTPGEVANVLAGDAGAPTFDEALRVIFGIDGILSARAPLRGSPADVIAAWESEEEWDTAQDGPWLGQSLQDATDAAQLERAAQQHPLIASFVERIGLRRLRGFNANDAAAGGQGDDGKRTDLWDRKELLRAWTEHVDAQDGREVAALAAGTGQRGLSRLDPLAALGIGTAPAELEAGESA